ncbi:MAG: TonB-dependent receptor, partial [Pseudomonadota bacterium]
NLDVKSVVRRVPNTFAEDGIQLPAIRGIDGTAGLRQAITAGTQPRVPILIDDVARPLTNAFSLSRSSTWDVDSVEVARGPQPSSTGRNALAGAIRVYTNDPSFELEAAARLRGFSTDGTIDGAGMLNVPIVADQLAFRGTFEESRGEGFIDVLDPTNFSFDPERELYRRYRGKLLFAPSAVPGLELQASVDFMRTEGQLPGFFDGNEDDRSVTAFGLASSYEENDQITYIGRARYALTDNLEVEGRISHIDNDFLLPDAQVGIGNFFVDQKETEGEAFLRITRLGAIKRGILGVIHNEAREDSLSDSPVFGFTTDGEISNTGIYGEMEIGFDWVGLPDDLVLIAGGRYEIDDRSRRVDVNGVTASDRDLSERQFLPKIGLRYSPTDDLTIGYTYSESFRPGGVDVDTIGAFLGAPSVAIAEFGPESIRQHEVYARSDFLEGRLSIGATGFYYTYDDAQLPGASPVVDGFGQNRLGNVPRARGYGAEVEMTAILPSGFSLTGGLGLLDTEITDAGSILSQFQGEELPRAPSVTASATLAYDNGAGFSTSASARYVGDTNSGLGQPEIDGYFVVDLAAGYDLGAVLDIDLRVDVFIENLTDKTYFTFREDNPTLDLQAVGRPRTFGLAATYRF